MEAIKNEIDAFQTNCENLLRSQLTKDEPVEEGSESVRGDIFLQSSIRIQSELIGKVLLEVRMNILVKNRLMTIVVGFMGR